MSKPVIGITSDFVNDTLGGRPWNSVTLLCQYTDALTLAGGLPVILPLANADNVRDYLDRLDGILLSGGVADIPADVLGEKPHPTTTPISRLRWDSECLWLRTALDLDKPILGVCLGMQIMNVIAGGKIVQDIPSQWSNAGPHTDASRRHPHEVEVKSGTILAGMAPSNRVTVTSAHHQAITNVPAPYEVSAKTDDGIVEAIEDPAKRFVVGVQWHPERNPEQPDWLLSAFVRYCIHG